MNEELSRVNALIPTSCTAAPQSLVLLLQIRRKLDAHMKRLNLKTRKSMAQFPPPPGPMVKLLALRPQQVRCRIDWLLITF